MNKLVYSGLSILQIIKIVMYEFWYDYVKPDYVKPKYGEKAKLYYVDTDSFKVYIKTEDFYLDVAKDIET